MLFSLLFAISALAGSIDGMREFTDRGAAKDVINALEQVIEMPAAPNRNAQFENIRCENSFGKNACVGSLKGKQVQLTGPAADALVNLFHEMQVDAARNGNSEVAQLDKLFCDEWPYKTNSGKIYPRYRCLGYSK